MKLIFFIIFGVIPKDCNDTALDFLYLTNIDKSWNETVTKWNTSVEVLCQSIENIGYIDDWGELVDEVARMFFNNLFDHQINCLYLSKIHQIYGYNMHLYLNTTC